jgi:hypothetical protein
MSSTIITQVVEEMNDLPDSLQQQVLKFVITVRQAHIQLAAAQGAELEPYETPTEKVIESLRQGFHEAFTGQTIPLAQMWDGIDAE